MIVITAYKDGSYLYSQEFVSQRVILGWSYRSLASLWLTEALWMLRDPVRSRNKDECARGQAAGDDVLLEEGSSLTWPVYLRHLLSL